jgi:hypothetical protein
LMGHKPLNKREGQREVSRGRNIPSESPAPAITKKKENRKKGKSPRSQPSCLRPSPRDGEGHAEHEVLEEGDVAVLRDRLAPRRRARREAAVEREERRLGRRLARLPRRIDKGREAPGGVWRERVVPVRDGNAAVKVIRARHAVLVHPEEDVRRVKVAPAPAREEERRWRCEAARAEAEVLELWARAARVGDRRADIPSLPAVARVAHCLVLLGVRFGAVTRVEAEDARDRLPVGEERERVFVRALLRGRLGARVCDRRAIVPRRAVVT